MKLTFLATYTHIHTTFSLLFSCPHLSLPFALIVAVLVTSSDRLYAIVSLYGRGCVTNLNNYFITTSLTLFYFFFYCFQHLCRRLSWTDPILVLCLRFLLGSFVYTLHTRTNTHKWLHSKSYVRHIMKSRMNRKWCLKFVFFFGRKNSTLFFIQNATFCWLLLLLLLLLLRFHSNVLMSFSFFVIFRFGFLINYCIHAHTNNVVWFLNFNDALFLDFFGLIQCSTHTNIRTHAHTRI